MIIDHDKIENFKTIKENRLGSSEHLPIEFVIILNNLFTQFQLINII